MRSRWETVPSKFNSCCIINSKQQNKRKRETHNRKTTSYRTEQLQQHIDNSPTSIARSAVRMSLLWNKLQQLYIFLNQWFTFRVTTKQKHREKKATNRNEMQCEKENITEKNWRKSSEEKYCSIKSRRQRRVFFYITKFIGQGGRENASKMMRKNKFSLQ